MRSLRIIFLRYACLMDPPSDEIADKGPCRFHSSFKNYLLFSSLILLSGLFLHGQDISTGINHPFQFELTDINGDGGASLTEEIKFPNTIVKLHDSKVFFAKPDSVEIPYSPANEKHLGAGLDLLSPLLSNNFQCHLEYPILNGSLYLYAPISINYSRTLNKNPYWQNETSLGTGILINLPSTIDNIHYSFRYGFTYIFGHTTNIEIEGFKGYTSAFNFFSKLNIDLIEDIGIFGAVDLIILRWGYSFNKGYSLPLNYHFGLYKTFKL